MTEDVLKRHLARDYVMKLTDVDGREDEIKIKPLSGDSLVEFMLLLKDLNSLGIDVKTEKQLKAMTEEEKAQYDVDEGTKFFTNMTKPMMERLSLLVSKSLKVSFPTYSDEVLEGFKMAHPFELFMAVMKCNSPAVSVN